MCICFIMDWGDGMDIVRVFGSNVRRHRMRQGWSQESFAEKCGMHRTYISGIECCRRNISLENIQRIADALDVDAYLLLMEEDNADEVQNKQCQAD